MATNKMYVWPMIKSTVEKKKKQAEVLEVIVILNRSPLKSHWERVFDYRSEEQRGPASSAPWVTCATAWHGEPEWVEEGLAWCCVPWRLWHRVQLSLWMRKWRTYKGGFELGNCVVSKETFIMHYISKTLHIKTLNNNFKKNHLQLSSC